jgi:signal transduction histidine kinase
MKAQEDERSRVARDLHDTVAQDLAALRLEAERMVGRVEDDPALATSLAGFEERARQMLDTVRRILLDLRLSLLESLGFVPASKWLLERMERDHGIETRLLVDDESDAHLEYETAIMLFRILQESLLNVTQHAAAERVFVTIRLEESRVELTVEDDGRGFDPESLRASVRDGQRGLGILGMEERARLLGGALELASAPGEGTTVVVRVQRAARPTRRSAAVG